VEKHQVARFGVSLSKSLLKELDRMVRQKGYRNRSLALGDMVRDQLVEHRREKQDAEAVGTITLVYDHHRSHVQETLTDLQHQHLDTIISTLHVHLDHQHCLEVLVVRGKASLLRATADRLIAAKGVKHGKLTLTATGKDLPE
jgi:CopG family nickel-responsive transcriptional regulator